MILCQSQINTQLQVFQQQKMQNQMFDLKTNSCIISYFWFKLWNKSLQIATGFFVANITAIYVRI